MALRLHRKIAGLSLRPRFHRIGKGIESRPDQGSMVVCTYQTPFESHPDRGPMAAYIHHTSDQSLYTAGKMAWPRHT